MGVPVRVAGTIDNVLDSTVTCVIGLTNRFGGGSKEISLMCNGKGVGSDTMMDWGPWCKCNFLWRASQYQSFNYGEI